MTNFILDARLSVVSGRDTLADLILSRVRISGSEPAVRFKVNGTCRTDSWEDLAGRFTRLARHIHECGVGDEGRVGVFLPTSYSWALTDAACLVYGWTSAVYHLQWSKEELAHAIKLFPPDLIICDDARLAALKAAFSILGWSVPLLSLNSDNNIFTETFLEDFPMSLPVDRDSVATVVFTSGTHGAAKGTMLTQKAMLMAACEAYNQLGFDSRRCNALHWLPTSHMFGRLGLYMNSISGSVSYFCGDVENLAEDLKIARPDYLFSVPRMLSRLRLRIEEGVRQESAQRQAVFWVVLRVGYLVASLPESVRVPVQGWVRLLFTSLHQRLGGRLRLIIVGGAPVDPVDKQYFEALGIAVREGFGMTETAGVASVQPFRRSSQGCGPLLPSLEARVDREGQLLLRGRSLLSGYIGENGYDEEGWFATGDIARLDRKGNLSITGRVKDLIIPDTGENVSPVKIENLLMRHSWIADACVVGDRRPCLISLLSLSAEGVMALRREGGDAFGKRLDSVIARMNTMLPRFERIQGVVVLPGGFDAKNGEVTVTHKIRRRVILSRHASLINQCYEMLERRKGRHIIPEG